MDNIEKITNLAEKLSTGKPGGRVELDEDEMALLGLTRAPHIYWGGFLWGFAIGVAITLLVTGYYAWVAIGAVPLLGRMIQGKIKRKAKKAIGIENPPNRGHGLRDRG